MTSNERVYKPDLTDQVFEYLTAKTLVIRKGKRYWRCECVCGVFVVVHQMALRNGNTKSCGCKKGQMCAAVHTKHGGAARGKKHPLYNIWRHIWERCTSKTTPRWHRYGGRGITVCARWRDFRNFVADMSPRPPGTSLDRRDNNKGYCKANCRWATPKQQANNTIRSRKITRHGETHTMPEWSDILGIKVKTLRWRYYIAKWPIAQVLHALIPREKSRTWKKND